MSPQFLTTDLTAATSIIEESLIWKNLLEGDRKALANIYSRYFDKLYNYGVKITSETAIVEDSIQDLFIELWNRREGLNKEVKNIKFYLYICLRRKILLKLGKKNNNIEISELQSFDIQLSHKSHYLNNQMNTELKFRLVQMVETLTPKQKEAIFLIYFDELSYQEAADIMGLKIKTVYNLIHQAISRLKERKSSFWNFISF